MVIAHYKKTPIANAPEAISDIINRYTEHQSYVFGYGYPTSKVTPRTTIVHQHNLDVIQFKKKLIQYHSEPFRVDLNTKIKKLVIAQYHATLPEYKNAIIVRNPIDIYDELFLPKYYDGKIRIGYSPSTTTVKSIWADKGYAETALILSKLKSKYGSRIDIDIITNVNLIECLKRKSLCNIFIDEVKTPSYHRSGLESLGMGIATICSIGTNVEKVMLKSSGANSNPFINVGVNDLYNKLSELIEKDIYDILNIGYDSRIWMEKYWNPIIIANEYINIYNEYKP